MAEQVSRPKIDGRSIVGSHLEWRFHCQELDPVLIKTSDMTVAAIDDPTVPYILGGLERSN